MNTHIKNALPVQVRFDSPGPRADFQYFGRYFTTAGPVYVPDVLFYIPRYSVRRKIWLSWGLENGNDTQVKQSVIDVTIRFHSPVNPGLDRLFLIKRGTPPGVANKTAQLIEGSAYSNTIVAVPAVGQTEGEVIAYKYTPAHARHTVANHFIGEYDKVTVEIGQKHSTGICPQHCFIAVYSEQSIESR